MNEEDSRQGADENPKRSGTVRERVKRLGAVRDRGRTTLRIARWEVDKSTGSVDRETLFAFGIAALLLVAAAPVLLGGGVALDEDIYHVAIEEDHEYYPAVVDHSALRPVDEPDDADLLVSAAGISHDGTQKSRAAAAELRSAIEAYNNRQLAAEENQSAAFPVVVELRHEPRTLDRDTLGEPATGIDGDPVEEDPELPPDDSDIAGGEVDDGEPPEEDSDSEPPGERTGDDTDETTADDTDRTAGDEPVEDDTAVEDDTVADGEVSPADDGSSIPDVGGTGLFEEDQVGTPADIDPPFPFAPLILAFLFIIPMNFVIQAYGSTIINERLNRRGELLLVAPVSPAEIVAGKTLPYFLVLLATTAVIAAAVRGGLLSVLAVVPLAMLFLAATFVGGMFARSYKELTFVTVTISVFLTTYAFVPAIFTDVTPIALISPLTLVVRDLQGVGASAVEYAFSTGPIYLSSLVLFALGLGVYREEDMFTQRAIHRKAIDALAAHLHRPRHVFVVTAFLLPFVFVLQLLSIAVLFPLPLEVGFLFVLVFAATVEEIAKSIHVFAGYEHDRFDRRLSTVALLGALSGAGFFVAEKIAHAGQLVGLDDIELGQVVFQIGLDIAPGLSVVVFFLPLGLHVLTATIAIAGARSGAVHYAVALGIAIIVHVAYNLGVLLYVV